MPDLVAAVAGTAVCAGPAPSAQTWFEGGERVGYNPKARAIVAAPDAPLKIFVRREVLRALSPSCLDFLTARSAG
jgi:hypothetical protein